MVNASWRLWEELGRSQHGKLPILDMLSPTVRARLQRVLMVMNLLGMAVTADLTATRRAG